MSDTFHADNQTRYFLLLGDALKAYRSWLEYAQGQRKKLYALLDEIGTEKYATNSGLGGLSVYAVGIPEAGLPRGWKTSKQNREFMVPDGRSKLGLIMRQRLHECRRESPKELVNMARKAFGYDVTFVIVGNSARAYWTDTIGDAHYFMTPTVGKRPQNTMPGCFHELRPSEYLALKEAEASASASSASSVVKGLKKRKRAS
jgi:hypothetical protein